MNRGRDAEARAEAHLVAAGLQPVCRNYRCRSGEIDLVLRDGDTLVIVEVRHRSRDSHGGAAASVDRHKQRRIIGAARHYLGQAAHGDPPAVRFDVVCIDGDQAIDWIPSAFEASEYCTPSP